MTTGTGAYGLVGDYRYSRAFEQLVALPNLAGDDETIYKVGGTYVERIASIGVRLTTVGGAGVRTGLVQFVDQSDAVFAAAAQQFTVAAGHTSQLTWSVGANPGGANNGLALIQSLPPLFLQPGYKAIVSIDGGLAADSQVFIRILTEKFSTAPADFAPGQGGDRVSRDGHAVRA